MEEHQRKVGVHRIWDPAQDPKEKALFLPGFRWVSHEAHVTDRDSGALNSQGLVVGEKTLPKPRCGAGNEVASLRALRKTPSSSGREVLTFLSLSPRERDGRGREG